MNIKGLDDWITGKNDPNAPFNQTDLSDTFSEVFDFCEEWLTEKMFSDEKTYERIETILTYIMYELRKDKYASRLNEHLFISDNAYLIAQMLEKKFNEQIK